MMLDGPDKGIHQNSRQFCNSKKFSEGTDLHIFRLDYLHHLNMASCTGLCASKICTPDEIAQSHANREIKAGVNGQPRIPRSITFTKIIKYQTIFMSDYDFL